MPRSPPAVVVRFEDELGCPVECSDSPNLGVRLVPFSFGLGTPWSGGAQLKYR